MQWPSIEVTGVTEVKVLGVTSKSAGYLHLAVD